MKKLTCITAMAVMAILLLSGCGGKKTNAGEAKTPEGTRTVVDGAGREVEIPETVESIVCLNVGTLRYTCYMDAQEMVIGVEDYEQKQDISRPYHYVNFDLFKDLPVVGTNGESYPEAIIEADPDVIMMSALDGAAADEMEAKTGIPVVLVPGSDKMMDEGAYETFRIMGEVYGKEERAKELTAYLDQVRADLESRTKDGSDLTAYVGGVSYKGHHGFEGTEAGYGPLAVIGANNLADQTDQKGPFNVDREQVLSWNPDVIFLDFNGMELIKEDYEKNPDYYKQLKAVQEGRVYSQISFRSSASNLDTALADAYYAASILYPDQFADVDPAEKADEIFQMFLGCEFYETLKENGYEFRQIQIGEE